MDVKVSSLNNSIDPIVIDKNKLDFGFIRLEQTRNIYSDISKTNKLETIYAFVSGNIIDLKRLGWTNNQKLSGKIIIQESLSPFNKENPDADLKRVNNTGIIYKSNGKPIYKRCIYSPTETRQDIFVPYDNIDEVNNAFNNLSIDALSKLKQNGIQFSNASFWKAIENGNKEIVELFMQAGIDSNYRNDFGETSLHWASTHGRFQIGEMLINAGASVNIHNYTTKFTPLHCAAMSGHQDVIELLLNKGADINSVDKDGNTALHYAALANREDALKKLISKKANINAKSNDGHTPMALASFAHHSNICNILKQSGGY